MQGGWGWKEGLGVEIFVFFPTKVRIFLVACSDFSLAVRTMSVEGCSEGHSSVERPVREILRWTLPCTRKLSGSPVRCSLPYFTFWSRWFDRLYEGGNTIPLVGELGCVDLLNRIYCQGTLAAGGRFGS